MSEKTKQTAKRLAERKQMQIDEAEVILAIVENRKLEGEELAKNNILINNVKQQIEKLKVELQEFQEIAG